MSEARPTLRDLPIAGMHCAACAGSVEKILGRLPGVGPVSVNFATARVRLEGGPPLSDLHRALAKGGYGIGTRRTTLRKVPESARRSLAAADGVERVEEEPDRLVVVHADAPEVREFLRGLQGVEGVETESDPEAAGREREIRSWRARFLVGLLLGAPVLLAGIPGAATWLPAFLHDPRLLLALTLPVQFLVGWPFLAGAFAALRARRADMNTLVAVGTLAAFGWSAWLVLDQGAAAHDHYFDGSVAIVVLVCLGRWLEARARGAAGAAVAALARLEPETALLMGEGGDREVPVSRLLEGDRVRVRPGGTIPADGVVEEGSAPVDESMLTGESIPVAKGPGDPVTGGTRLGPGTLVVRATAVGEATALRRIVAWVRAAQSGKAPIARLADRVSAIFVPAVVLVTLGTLGGWLLAGGGAGAAVEAAVAVLVVACPCALGLATPTAILVGTGRAASRGILFRGGEVIERAASVGLVAFDKTGTLTLGRPQVVFVEAFGAEEREVLRLAAAVEEGSEHPLAGAVRAAVRERGIEPPPVRSFEARPGLGAGGEVEGCAVLVGNPRFLEERRIDLSAARAALARADGEGATPLLVAVDSRVVGLIAARDRERPGAREAVAALRSAGFEVVLISGDRRAAAEATARRLGIETALSEVPPIEKAAAVRRLSAGDRVVAMVGDGVNDAPALAEASVGIAVRGATDVATAAAGIALARDEVARVPEALSIARRTLRTIRQNLFLAFVYNTLAIPVAAAGLLDPMIAAAAMSLSSVSVVGNSLRLRGARLA